MVIFAIFERREGRALDLDEQRRRYLLQSILNVEGLDVSRYAGRFGSDPCEDFPELHTFAVLGLLEERAGSWRPTETGLEWSDALGPWLFSERVRQLMAEYESK